MPLEIHKKIVLDENNKPFAVQIPIEEFIRMEEVVENFGLSKLMDEIEEEDVLQAREAQDYYQALKANVEG